MPPKRSRATKASARQAQSASSSRPSRKSGTKSDALSIASHAAQNDTEIMRAFQMFAIPRNDIEDVDDDDNIDNDEDVLKIVDVRKCLSALKLPKPPSDFFDDPAQTYLSATEFLAIAQTLRDSITSVDTSALSSPQLSNEDNSKSDEVVHAFSLFTHNRPGQGIKITMADLRRVAKDLREDIDEATLRLMIEEANGEQGRESVARGVALEDFEDVMKRAGVFG